jgi:hypothetical protein
LVRTVREHLILNGQDPNFRMWKGPDTRDSSDEEWEGHMHICNQRLPVELDSHMDIRGMVDNAFLEECECFLPTLMRRINKNAHNGF